MKNTIVWIVLVISAAALIVALVLLMAPVSISIGVGIVTVTLLNKGTSSKNVESISLLIGGAVPGGLMMTAWWATGVQTDWNNAILMDWNNAILIIAFFVGVAGGVSGHLWHELWEKRNGSIRPYDLNLANAPPTVIRQAMDQFNQSIADTKERNG